jgi:hypothetical protein
MMAFAFDIAILLLSHIPCRQFAPATARRHFALSTAPVGGCL